MKLLIAPNGVSTNVINSQLVPIFNSVEGAKYLLCHASHKDRLNTEIADVVFFKNSFEMISLIIKINPDKVYCRDVYNFYSLYIIRLVKSLKYKIYSDVRALSFEELKFKKRNKFKVVIMRCLEQFMIQKSDYISVVSNNLKSHILDILEWKPKSLSVFPCTYSFNPVNKEDYNKNNFISFVYVGGMSKWQKFDIILKFILRVKEKRGDIKFLILTGDVLQAERIITKECGNIPYFIEIKTVSQSKIKDEISNFHYGIVFRDDVLMNKVASPIKVGEYLGAGLVPILSSGVGDYSDFVTKYNIGYKIDIYDFDKGVNNIIEDYDDGSYIEIYNSVIKINHLFYFFNNIKKHFFIK
ncbi:hypothetical protein [Photobacterium damselae]|uniref:hypothetical protein n=1 Tax=Photobacterium damselae TaxID=38293 RepID=UPI00406857FB